LVSLILRGIKDEPAATTSRSTSRARGESEESQQRVPIDPKEQAERTKDKIRFIGFLEEHISSRIMNGIMIDPDYPKSGRNKT
jgi:hypothetical protein